ncbi:MAG TPA: OmpA family protein [Terriglobales bacterium]|nr:OmpA family protein [Terriglobales bacterium]
MMKRLIALSFMAALAGACASEGQQTVFPNQSMEAPRFDIAAGYHLINANAPPADCGCFTAHGGFVGVQYNLSSRLGLAGQVGTVHASKISLLGQNLLLTTFLAGPRISVPGRRITPFGEFMLGGAYAGDSYFPGSSSGSSTASTFAYSAGGGLDFNMSDRMAIRLFDASFLHTSFPNAANGSQRQLQINAGIVMHFGGTGGGASRQYVAAVEPALKEPKGIALACYTNNHIVNSGRPVHISAETSVDPDRYYFTYDWTTTGGAVVGHGNAITINTDGLTPGTYTVAGHAALDSNPSTQLSCKVDFQVAPPQDQKQELMTKIAAPPGDNSFDLAAQKSLRDAFFDYDQADLRPDAARAVLDDAAFLVAHPSLRITLAGYADERGSAEYNVALGMERAEATRNALMSAGVDASRIEVVSYGKERPFCSEENETCYQQNRRAQFVIE